MTPTSRRENRERRKRRKRRREVMREAARKKIEKLV